MKNKNRFMLILVILLILSSNLSVFARPIIISQPAPTKYERGKYVGEERNVVVYKTANQMLLDAGSDSYHLTTAGFTHKGLSFLIKKYGTSAVNPYIGGGIIATGIYSWMTETELRYAVRNGLKGAYFHYTYRYELPYGDPTTMPRWRMVRTRVKFVY